MAKGREVAIQVHHINGIDWDGLLDMVELRLLAGPYKVLCSDCHHDEHLFD